MKISTFFTLLCIQLSMVQAGEAKPPLPPHDVITAKNAAKITELTAFDHTREATSIAFSPDGTKLLSGGGQPILWDVQSGQKIRTYEVPNYTHYSEVGFSPDGKLVTGTGRYTTEGSEGALGILSIWDTASGKLVGSIEGYGGQERIEITNAVFSPDGQQFVLALPPTLWNTAQVLKAGYITRNDDRHELHLQAEYGIQAAYSPDGKTFIIGGNGGTIYFWDAVTGELQKSFTAAENSDLYDVAFSPDGKWVASAISHVKSRLMDMPLEVDYTVVNLWDVETGKLIRALQGAQNSIFSIAFSPDGKLLVSGSLDRSVLIWDVRSGKQVASIQANEWGVWDVAFSPDGKLIATAGQNGMVQLWGVPMR